MNQGNRQRYKFIAVILFLALLIPVLATSAHAAGEPLAGAEITVKQQPGDEVIAVVVTDAEGKFAFDLASEGELPPTVTVNLYITPPEGTEYEYETSIVEIVINTAEGLHYEGVLLWVQAGPKAIQGGFAVSGRSSTIAPPLTYDIKATADPNGSITPSGSITVNSGASQSFTITPNSGYQIADVLVDNVSQGAISSYTFNNVTANHTIDASFTTTGPALLTITAISPNSAEQGQTIELTISGEGFVSGTTLSFFPPTGITVTSLSFASATELKASISIDENAPTSTPKDVIVTNPDEQTRMLAGGFTVNAAFVPPVTTPPGEEKTPPPGGEEGGTSFPLISIIVGVGIAVLGVASYFVWTKVRRPPIPTRGEPIGQDDIRDILKDIPEELQLGGASMVGEPPPGAVITLEQEPDDSKKMIDQGGKPTGGIKVVRGADVKFSGPKGLAGECETVKGGKFAVKIPEGIKLPSKFNLTFQVKPKGEEAKTFIANIKLPKGVLEAGVKQFNFIVWSQQWRIPGGKPGKGIYTRQMWSTVNHYGINEDGIKLHHTEDGSDEDELKESVKEPLK